MNVSVLFGAVVLFGFVLGKGGWRSTATLGAVAAVKIGLSHEAVSSGDPLYLAGAWLLVATLLCGCFFAGALAKRLYRESDERN
jgi:hypothetical protein